MFVNAVPAVEDIIHSRFYLRRHHIGQESQPADIDTDDGDVLVTHTCRSLQQRTIAAHRDGKIGHEVVTVKDAVNLDVHVLTLCYEFIERTVNKYLCIIVLQDGDKLENRLRFLLLIQVSEDGETNFLRHFIVLSNIFCTFAAAKIHLFIKKNK